MTVIVLEVPNRTPTLNNWVGKERWVYQKIRRTWAKEIKVAMLRAGVFGRPAYSGATIVIERHCVQLISDQDNLFGGLKPVMDGMISAGLLADDSDKHVSYTIFQFKAKRGAERTVFKIRLAPAAETRLEGGFTT